MKPYPNECIYMTVNGRCALPLDLLAQRLPEVEEKSALDVLRGHGFQFLSVDPVETAMNWVGKARYERAALMSLAPEVVDCSGFVKWVYGRMGLHLPRRSVQQCRLGMPVDDRQSLLPGDLVFSQSRHNRQMPGDPVPVGHAGMYIGNNTVVHSTRESGGVETIALPQFWRLGFAGARRILPRRMVTAVIPEGWETERADDMICVVYDTLKLK